MILERDCQGMSGEIVIARNILAEVESRNLVCKAVDQNDNLILGSFICPELGSQRPDFLGRGFLGRKSLGIYATSRDCQCRRRTAHSLDVDHD